MRVAVLGATGFIGRQVLAQLEGSGHEAVALTRNADRAAEVLGEGARVVEVDPYEGASLRPALDGVEGIVNLCGESIFGQRWTRRVQQVLRDSRVLTTRALFDAIHPVDIPSRPRVLVNASAIGFYGSSGPEKTHTEGDFDPEFAPENFLEHLCWEWESEALRIERLGPRVVRLRIGVVLGKGGGALAEMEPIFRKGLGGRIGSGRQVVSWIHVHDLCRAIAFCLSDERMKGPVNATAPHPVDNRELTRALAAALRRPAFFPLPGPMARLILGRGRAEVLLTGQRVLPVRLEEAGFDFRFPRLQDALANLFPRPHTD